MKKIGIIGCGWLGFPLAKSFIKDEYTVLGTTTSFDKHADIKAEGIKAFVISLFQDKIDGDITSFLENLDVLILNVPPKLRATNASNENYVKKMQLLHTAIKETKLKKIVFTSSTSVYGDINGDVTEKTTPLPVTESGKQILASENIFTKDNDLNVAIVRFAGLIGPERQPVISLSKKTTVANGNFPVNLIHLEDCIRVIKAIVEKEYWNIIFNAAYPLHPTKEEYYTLQAKKLNIPAPRYTTNKNQKGKKIISNNLINIKGFKFLTSINN